MTKKILIIGGGFAGCAAAEFLKKIPRADLTLIEKSNTLGAGVRTYFKGGHPYTFGPRHFLTKQEWIFEYLNKIIPMRKCIEHEFLTYVENDENFYSYPIHEDDIRLMPESDQINKELNQNKNINDAPKTLEEYWIHSVGPTLYHKFIKDYSKKMWGVKNNNEIDDFGWSPKGTALKSGPRAAWDTAISAYPIKLNGYNDYFDIATNDINVQLNTNIDRYDIENKSIYLNGEKKVYDIIVNTISPDILFDFCYGELPYMGRDIQNIILPIENALPNNVYFAYYASKEPFTRITEYKKFSRYESPSTLISIETPSKNGRHYPMPFTIEYQRAEKYFSLFPNDVYSIGRAGSYRYSVDIDDCIEQAKNIYEKVK